MSELCGAMNSPSLCLGSVLWCGGVQDSQPDHDITASPSPAPARRRLVPEPPPDQKTSDMLPTSLLAFFFIFSSPPALLPPSPALPVLTAPALAPAVPPDDGVAEKHQDQQGQPDTQDKPEPFGGLLPCKAEGKEVLQTNTSGRLGVLMIPWQGQHCCGAGDTSLCPVLSLWHGGTVLRKAVGHCGTTVFATPKAPCWRLSILVAQLSPVLSAGFSHTI